MLENVGLNYITPAVAGAAASAIGYVVDSRTWWQGGLIALFQGAIATQLARRMEGGYPPAIFVVSQIVMGGALYGLAFLAGRVGYLAPVLCMTGGAAAIATSLAVNLAGLIVTTALSESRRTPA